MSSKLKSTLTKLEIPYNLPNNWKWYRWKDLIEGFQQGLIRSNFQLGRGNVHYLKMGNLDGNGSCDINDLTITEANEKEISNYILNEGDFLINVRNSLDLVGKTCVLGKVYNRKILFNHMLVRIEHKSGISNYLINLFFNTSEGKRLLNRCKQGTTTVIALYQRDLYNIPIPIPDDVTSTFIASLYKKLLDKIDLNNRINKEMEAMAKLIHDYWFVQFDFPISQEQAAAMGKPELEGKPYRSSGGKMVYDRHLKREIPAGWEVEKVSDLSKKIQRGISPRYVDEGGICVLNQKCIRDKSINFDLARRNDDEVRNADAKLIELWDVLVNSTGVGTLGRVACVRRLAELKVTVDSHVTIVRADPDKIDKLYFGYALSDRQAEIEGFSQGSTGQVELSRDQLGSLSMIKPAKQIQKSFADLLSSIYHKIARNEEENQQLISLRDWLLPMLMNGQVTVRQAKDTIRQKEPVAYQHTEGELKIAAEERGE